MQDTRGQTVEKAPAKPNEFRLTLVRPSQKSLNLRVSPLIALTALPLFFVAIATFIDRGMDLTALFFLSVSVASVASVGAAAYQTRGKNRDASVRIESNGIYEGDVLLLERAQAASGYFAPSAHSRGHVSVRGKTGKELLVAEVCAADAERMLQHLGLDVMHRTVRWRVSPPLLASSARIVGWLAGAAALIALAVHIGAPWVVVALWAVLLVAFSLSLIPPRLTVGGDGVLWQWLLAKRFWHYADIATVDNQRNCVVLELKSGKDVWLATDAIVASSAANRREVVRQRIREGMAEHARGEQSSLCAQVARSGRSVEEWWRALQGLRTRRADYRTAPLEPLALWRVVEDPRLDPSARVGAAILLQPSLDAEGRSRLREFASNSASPRVRLAMEAIVEADDESQIQEAAALIDDTSVAKRQ